MITLKQFQLYEKILRPYFIPSCTISGGEPTLVPDMPEIISYAKKSFPFGVTMITNLYGNTNQIKRVIESALRNNITICVSFDGFGKIADRLRTGCRVSEVVTKHITMVSEMRKELKSFSLLRLHTVLSDINIDQLPDIIDLSKQLNWTHTVAPVNSFFYQEDNEAMPRLSLSKQLIEMCQYLSKQAHVSQPSSFIQGIPFYSGKRAQKLCPYLTHFFMTYKIFLEPNGEVSLCDRFPIGKLTETPLHRMFCGPLYEERIRHFKMCPGCWLPCFVEPLLFFKSTNLIRLDSFKRLHF